jgi:1-acyl-sn-glycerol-3-phosphate acyltransferase
MREHDGVESPEDVLPEVVGEDFVSTEDAAAPNPLTTTMKAVQEFGIRWVRSYHRLDVSGELEAPAEPVLFVANHGFGGIFDLNAFAIMAAFDAMNLDRPVTTLTHQIVWNLGVGRLLEPLGLRPASRRAAAEAFAGYQHVLVFPGGDLDAFKTFRDRNRIVFGGRSGFARLAIEAGVPIVPIVTSGAGESLLVLPGGQRLARGLRLDKAVRLKAVPVTLSLPWGFNVGTVGILVPHLPLPSRLATCVLPAMVPVPDETARHFAARVESTMQDALTALTEIRR